MRTCSVCGKNSLSNKERSYHKFPVNKLELLEKWVRNIRAADETWEPSRSSVLCSDHFVRECFNNAGAGRPRLLANAIPTLFDDVTKKKQESSLQTMDTIQEGCLMGIPACDKGMLTSQPVLPEAGLQNVFYLRSSHPPSIVDSEDVGIKMSIETASEPSPPLPADTDCNIVISEVWSSSTDVCPPEELIECETVACNIEYPSPPAVDDTEEASPMCDVYVNVDPSATRNGLELIRSQWRHFVYKLQLPSPAWTRHTYVSRAGSVGYALLSIDDDVIDPVAVEKLVLFDGNADRIPLGKVFLHGRMTTIVDVPDQGRAEQLLRDVDDLRPCCGAGKRADSKGMRLGTVRESGGRLFSEECDVQLTDAVPQQRRCRPCGILRKLLKGRISRINTPRKAPGDSLGNKMRCMAWNLRRRTLKIAQLEEQLRDANKINAALKRALPACEDDELQTLKES